MRFHMRLARPVTDLPRTRAMYCEGLGLQVLGEFQDHDGFDGVMLGAPDQDFHFEFTHCRRHPIEPKPTPEDLIVFYIPDLGEWHAACIRMIDAGFKPSASFNPYWELRGRTFVDPDGYRIVLENAHA